jgi:hypothetical protein
MLLATDLHGSIIYFIQINNVSLIKLAVSYAEKICLMRAGFLVNIKTICEVVIASIQLTCIVLRYEIRMLRQYKR